MMFSSHIPTLLGFLFLLPVQGQFPGSDGAAGFDASHDASSAALQQQQEAFAHIAYSGQQELQIGASSPASYESLTPEQQQLYLQQQLQLQANAGSLLLQGQQEQQQVQGQDPAIEQQLLQQQQQQATLDQQLAVNVQQNVDSGLQGLQLPQEQQPQSVEEQQQQLASDYVVPDFFQAVFITDVIINGQTAHFTINVTKAYAEQGASQFYKLLLDGFYDRSCFFRVVPKFVVQFGIAADPEVNKRWSVPILDDLVEISNEAWTVSFASHGVGTRRTQIFVNLADNSFLDAQGFAPFGEIVEGSEVFTAMYNPSPGRTGGLDQHRYETQGNAWLKEKVPKINCIQQAYISDQRMIGQ